MRIAFFTDTYLPTRDGVVSSVLLSKRELERLGHEVFIFAPAPEDETSRQEGVFYFRSVRFRRYQDYRVPMFPSNKCEILEELDVDVIHNHGLAFMALRSMFAGRTLKKPVVTTWHTNVIEAVRYYNVGLMPDEVLASMMLVYMRQLLRRSEVVIAPTEVIKNELCALVPAIRRIEVVPTGVDLLRFHPSLDGSIIRKRYGLEGKKVILHLGRIAPEKNLDLVLEGFKILAKRHPEVVLMIAGEGPAKKEAMQKARQLGIEERTVFTGFVTDEDLPMCYAACDVFTIASKFETQGLVILEAMSTGKPVVGIDYRAVAEIIHDGVDGILFQASPESWCEATERALAAPSRMAGMARSRAEQYSQGKGAERIVEIYRAAIASKRDRLRHYRSV